MDARTLSFEPPISIGLWWTLLLVGGAALLWYVHRRPEAVSRVRWFCISFLMGLGFLLVLLVLLNPTWIEPVPPIAGKPQLSIILDATGSMATMDGGQGLTRFAAASKTAASLSSELAGQFDVRISAFTDVSVAADLTTLAKLSPIGRSTDLAAALQDGLDADREQGQAIVLLSDGIHNAPGGVARIFDTLRYARSMDTPIYTRTFGGNVESLDLAVELRTPQDLAFVGQNVPIIAQVHHIGLDNGTAEVFLLEGGKEVARTQVTFVPGAAAEARFWIKRDRIGVYPYEVRVAALPGEKSQTNNVASYMLRVIDHPIRVLLLEGKPYWDSKFLVRTLSGVPAVELDSVVRLSDERLVRRTWNRQGDAPAATQTVKREQEWQIANAATKFLADPATLRNFQIVVLGRDAQAFLDAPAIANLQRWIAQDGGSLICYRGEPSPQLDIALSRILPVHWESVTDTPFHMQLTNEGRDLNWLPDAAQQASLGALPTLSSHSRIDRVGPLAVVLANGVGPSGQPMPTVVYQPYGSGRVVVIEGAGMWRWAFLPPQLQEDDGTYDVLWHSMLRWIASGVALMPGQKMTLRVDKISFGVDEAATATVLVRTDADAAVAPPVELSNVDRAEKQTFTPVPFGTQAGTFRVSFGKLPEGLYQVRLPGGDPADASTRSIFDVRNVSLEELDLQARPDLMARIASDSGGKTLGEDAAEQLVQEFQQYRSVDRPQQVIRIAAWDRWWVFLGLLGVWGLAWACRRSGGLI